MSKRLQVLLPVEEYKKISKISAQQQKSIADWVRECIRTGLAAGEPDSPDVKLGRILKFTRFSGPTGDIEQILAEIGKGQELP